MSDISKKAKGTMPDLPDAELEVMACLWQRGQATARQIRETMEHYRPMAHGSVVTLLKRLEAKTLVAKEKGSVGKAFVYTPTRRPGPTYRRILKNLSQRVFGGNRIALAASLFETQPPTSKELAELEKLLDELRDKTSKGGKYK
ncbi:MAG: BlaI/MecI/CopY family transcriptional regulator [bacterium]